MYAPGYQDDYTDKDALFLRKAGGVTSAGTVALASNLFSSPLPTNVTSPTTVTNEYHDVYFDFNLRPYTFAPWFSSKYLTQGSMQDFELNLPNVAGGQATLTATVWSLTASTDVNPDHGLQVLVNGQPVGQSAWSGGGKMEQVTFDVPAGVLHSGGNRSAWRRLRLTDRILRLRLYIRSARRIRLRWMGRGRWKLSTAAPRNRCMKLRDQVPMPGLWMRGIRTAQR